MSDAPRRAESNEEDSSVAGSWMAKRYVLWCVGCALLAVGLCSHALDNGLYFDDWGMMHRARYGDYHVDLRRPAEELLYRVRTREEGWLPWYTNLDATMAVFRPLPLQMHVQEFRLFPKGIGAMHAISLGWLAAAIGAFAWLARRLTSSPLAAALAVLFFALEDGHAASVEWLAARNLMMTAAFGAVALASQDAWRRDGWRPGAWLCPVSLGLAFVTSESALCIAVYLGCHAFFVDRVGLRERAVGALPWVGVTAAYVVYYAAAGYGVQGIGLYIDPIGQASLFAGAVARSVPMLVDTKLLGIPTLSWQPLWSPAVAVTVLVLLAVVFLPLLRRHAHLRFWALGLVLAQVPIAATAPQVRFFVVTALGGSILVAELVVHAVSGRRSIRSKPLGFAALAVGLAAFVAHGPASAYALTRGALIDGHHDAATLDRLYTRAEEAVSTARADQRVFIVNAPMQAIFGTGLLMRKARGQSRPLSSNILCPSSGRVWVQRRDEKTLVLRAERSFFGSDWPIYRAAPSTVGETAELGAFKARVVAIDDGGRPSIVSFELDRPLEDPGFVWKKWQDGQFVDFVPPALGEIVEVSSEAQ